MTSAESPGAAFRAAIKSHRPLQIVGCPNAFCALMAQRIGHRAVYVSGSGVSSASYALPDLGMTSLDDVLADVRRITGATSLPVLVDIDTGWGSTAGIRKTVLEMINAQAAAVHIEDQVEKKRCGHRPNKKLVSVEEMAGRVKAAVDARTDDDFFIMARTDAFSVEGLDRAIERAQAYAEAGADGIFAEAMESGEQYEAFRKALDVPVLANMTEFGKTPLYSVKELAGWGVDMVLYPITALRAMNRAAETVYRSILENGHQKDVLEMMQTRAEMYEYLDYHDYENKMDAVLEKGKKNNSV